jgi:NADH:ubiquinone oxidoreductase subunit F (NADH-binding)
MDRMIIESFPYRVIEGMAIAAYAVGASKAFLYLRSEYPLALQRFEEALEACRQRGYIGDRVMGSNRSLEFEVRMGAGAFVCGEETALIQAIEGKRGMPVYRPPFPSESGLWNRPTLINNVETMAMVPWIIARGPDSFNSIGTGKSRGTKTFALAGKINRGGLIEVPMGTTLGRIVEDIGGGVEGGKALKAIQVGGPSGGCIPASLADTPVDYEALVQYGSMMGSGGMVVLDETDCMVEVARYFLAFTQKESCGKCTFCRIGTRRMLEILEDLCEGKASDEDLTSLERLALEVKEGSLCGLGGSAPNPVLSTLKHFRDEYEAHLSGICPAGRCKALISYVITDECIGCTRCAQNCPADAIEMRPYEQHEVDDEKCIRCDTCRRVCPVDAVEVQERISRESETTDSQNQHRVHDQRGVNGEKSERPEVVLSKVL